MAVYTSFIVKQSLVNWALTAIIAVVLFACNTIKPTVSRCKEIKDYLSFAVELDTSRVALGDSVIMMLKFRNTTRDTVVFYPNAIYLLKVLPENFHSPRKDLRKSLNFGDFTELMPGEKSVFTQYLQADSSLFFRKINSFVLVYIAEPFPDNYAIYNTLCGSLQSPEITLEIIEKE